jgi:hypothetical protein
MKSFLPTRQGPFWHGCNPKTEPVELTREIEMIWPPEDEDVASTPSNCNCEVPSIALGPRRGPNKIHKGEGGDSKRQAPDKYDGYPYERCSKAFRLLLMMGYEGITTGALHEVGNLIEGIAEQRGIRLTHRNRAAHRRKPCAFHWFDENWPAIWDLYVATVRQLLGKTRGVKPKGRRKTEKGAKSARPLNP